MSNTYLQDRLINSVYGTPNAKNILLYTAIIEFLPSEAESLIENFPVLNSIKSLNKEEVCVAFNEEAGSLKVIIINISTGQGTIIDNCDNKNVHNINNEIFKLEAFLKFKQLTHLLLGMSPIQFT